MADSLGGSSESLSQKRSWVSCQSPDYTKPNDKSFHGIDPLIQFPKRSRSEQEFVPKHTHSTTGSTSEFTHDDNDHDASCKQDDKIVQKMDQNQDVDNLPGRSIMINPVSVTSDHPRAVTFTIGDVSQESIQKEETDTDDDHNDTEPNPCRTESIGDSEGSDDSEISDNSIGGTGWRPMKGPISWVQQQMSNQVDPYDILHQLLPDQAIPSGMNQLTLWKLIINIVSEPPHRKKLKDVNTLDQVVSLINSCKNIIVLTGAGVSVSCGIPDFRSRDGIYARLSVEYPDLPDPQAMFDIRYFRNNPKPFFKFAKEIYPGQFEPSKSHKFIQLIEAHNKLLRNYTQNIDTLEQVAGIKNVIQCHGSFATATCMVCKYKTDSEEVRDDIMNQIIPRCPNCPKEDRAILKPDIVFFGESLPSEFHDQMELDKDVCDLLIVIGSSLKVRPVALIPNSLPKHVPQVLINRETLKHLTFDVELLGDCDVILQELCQRLGMSWQGICTSDIASVQVCRDDMSTPSLSSLATPPHHPTPPNSEDNTRMSFQLGSEENSYMSVTQDTDSTDRNTQTINFTSHRPSPFNTDNFNGDSCMSFEDSQSRSGCEQMHQAHTTGPGDNTIKESKSMENITKNTRILSTTDSSDTSKAMIDEDRVNTENKSHTLTENSESTQSLLESQPQLEELRACWKPRLVNLASALKDKEFLFLPPHRYVFKGAEVYDEDFDDSSSTGSSDSGSLPSTDGELLTMATSSKPNNTETDMDSSSNQKNMNSNTISMQQENS